MLMSVRGRAAYILRGRNSFPRNAATPFDFPADRVYFEGRDLRPDAIILGVATAVATIVLFVLSALGVGAYDTPPHSPEYECSSTGIPGASVCKITTP